MPARRQRQQRTVGVADVEHAHEVVGDIGRNRTREHEGRAVGERRQDDGQRARIKEQELVHEDHFDLSTRTAHIVTK